MTTIVCQPETTPAIDDPALVDFILRRARDTAIVHVHPMAALTKGLRGEEMSEIGLLRAAGAVAFTDGARSVTNAQVMRRALSYAHDFDALVVHHTEDPDLVGEGVMNEGEFAARLGLLGIPKAAETIVLERDIRLVALTGSRYHAASVTCANRSMCYGAPKRRAVRDRRGIHQSSDLNEIDVGPYRTFFKLAPPLRAEEDRAALVDALASGLLDVVMSDHNPQDVEVKRLPFAEAASGAIGIETMLAAGPAAGPRWGGAVANSARGDVDAPSAAARPAAGTPQAGRAGGCHRRRPEVPWILDPGDAKIKEQKHAV